MTIRHAGQLRVGLYGSLLVTGLITGCGKGRDAGVTVPPSRDVPALFVDRANEAGIQFRHTNGATGRKRFPEITGSGCAFLDYDLDGYQDILLLDAGALPAGSGPQANALYHNTGDGRFANVTQASGLAHTGYTQGVAVGDYDNDGFPDVYITAYGGNRLFHNEHGTGKFTDVTLRAGVSDLEQGKRYALSAAWGDYNGDGRLDLFVTHYAVWSLEKDRPCRNWLNAPSYCSPETYAGDVSRLYRNDGKGVFTDVTAAAGLSGLPRRAMGVTWLDYDLDGRPDLFVACDLQPNLLLHNTGRGTFKNVADAAGVAYGAMGGALSGMGVAVGDYDNDGRPDLHVTNFSHQPNSLLRNLGHGLFEHRGMQAGLEEPSNALLGWGCEFFDYDRDGFQDLIVANGHMHEDVADTVPGVTYREPKSLYRNTLDGNFSMVQQDVGDLAVPTLGRGLAVGDYDNDGRPDLLVNNENGPAQLLRNEERGPQHWLSFRLEGRRSNRDAKHARISLQVNGQKQFAEVRSGTSYCSASDARVLFGVGSAQRVERVEVRWPDGGIAVATDLAVDRLRHWVEGERAPREVPGGRIENDGSRRP